MEGIVSPMTCYIMTESIKDNIGSSLQTKETYHYTRSPHHHPTPPKYPPDKLNTIVQLHWEEGLPD